MQIFLGVFLIAAILVTIGSFIIGFFSQNNWISETQIQLFGIPLKYIVISMSIYLCVIGLIYFVLKFTFEHKGVAINPCPLIAKQISANIVDEMTDYVKSKDYQVGEDEFVYYYGDSPPAPPGKLMIVSLSGIENRMAQIGEKVEIYSRELINISTLRILVKTITLAFLLITLGTYLIILVESTPFKTAALRSLDAVSKGASADILEALEINFDDSPHNQNLKTKLIELTLRLLSSLSLIAIFMTDIHLFFRQKSLRMKFIKELRHEDFIYACKLTRREILSRLQNKIKKRNIKISDNDIAKIKKYTSRLSHINFDFER